MRVQGIGGKMVVTKGSKMVLWGKVLLGKEGFCGKEKFGGKGVGG